MKKILLIPSPNFLQQHLEPYVPIGLYSLQSLSANYNLCIDIFPFYRMDYKKCFKNNAEFVSYLLEFIDFDIYNVIGLSTICNSFHHSLKIASQIKSKVNNINIWLGGPQASLFPDKILKEFKFIDAVFVGESEKAVSEVLMRRQTGNMDISNIPGVYTRKSKYLEPSLLLSMDELPYVYDSQDFISCFQSTSSYKFPLTIPLEASRGCPGRCIFCSTKSFWGNKVRRKTNERLIHEMRQIYNMTNINKFMFLGDHFGFPKSKLLAFCKTLVSEKTSFEWNCNIKMNQLNYSDLDILWESGCRGIFIGVESASQKTLDLIKKDVIIEKELQLIDRSIEKGFLIETSFIIGFPWETEQDINDTYNLHSELLKKGVFRSQIWVLCPLPGTEITQKYLSSIKWDTLKSRIALDDIPMDSYTINLTRSYPEMFTQFGYIENKGLDWISISATADAAHQLNNIYFNNRKQLK